MQVIIHTDALFYVIFNSGCGETEMFDIGRAPYADEHCIDSKVTFFTMTD
ncbi:MAG: hypothetical protein AMXMBFR4_19230 [Candidatus Hydrogenedentota bacterium]